MQKYNMEFNPAVVCNSIFLRKKLLMFGTIIKQIIKRTSLSPSRHPTTTRISDWKKIRTHLPIQSACKGPSSATYHRSQEPSLTSCGGQEGGGGEGSTCVVSPARAPNCVPFLSDVASRSSPLRRAAGEDPAVKKSSISLPMRWISVVHVCTLPETVRHY